jgi:orotidine-5'-phosphate decarboxylase
MDGSMEKASFQQRLRATARANDSWLCVGLDPDPALMPPGVNLDDFLRGIVEATRDLACCFKPQIAFYEALGMDGLRSLRSLLALVSRLNVPVLVDAKRGDVPATAAAYARALFEDLGADAVTVNPYIGGDSLAPFFDYADRGVFVLCKTSNPGAGEIQDLLVDGSEPLFLRVARQAATWDRFGTLGLVVGATYPSDVARVRALAPHAPILLPGVGAQAGELDASVAAGLDANGGGTLVNASRSILYASRSGDWQAAARAEALRLRDAINAARATRATAAP